MIRSLIYSISFHSVMILLTVLSLPFMLREPIDLPPIVSVELIQISDKTNIPYAPKARKIIEDSKKKEEERMVSEQAPPAAKAKEKPDRIPMPDEKKEKKKIVKKKQNPEEVKPQIRQSSEFEQKELVDTNQIAALIDKAKEVEAVEEKKNNKITQSTKKNSFASGLTLSEEDALRAQIFGCWSVPLGLPYDQNLLVRIKLQLKQDGTIMKSEILDHERMNKPGQKFYKVLAESALRAVRLCQPLKVPPTGYDKWKDLQLNFNPMIKVKMRKILFIFLFLFLNKSTYALIEVDITRGNLDPLPIAVSPLHVDIKSEQFKELKVKELGEKISKIIETNFKNTGLLIL